MDVSDGYSRTPAGGWTIREGEHMSGSTSVRRVDRPLPRQPDRTYGGSVTIERLMTVKEAAVHIGCCEETVRRAYLARQLRVEHIGMRSIRVRPSDLQSWLTRGGKTTAV